MTDPDIETAASQPPPVLPVIDYPTQSAGNGDATRALLFGLLGFLPFVTGILAIRYGRRGLARHAAEPRAGGAGQSRAGMALGVISLVAWSILVLMLPSAIIRSRRAAMRVQCMSQLRQIGMASQLYAAQNRGFLPASLDDLVGPPGMVPPQLFICPAARGDASKPPASSGKYGNYSYVYLGAGRRIQTIRNPAMTPLAYEPPTNHTDGWMNVLYMDGHAEMVQGPQAQAILALTPASVQSSSATTQPSSAAPAAGPQNPAAQPDVPK